MSKPSVDDDLDLGLRPESRTERRANRRKQRARRGFGCFAVIISLLVVGALVGGAVVGFGKGKDALEKVFAAPDYEGDGEGVVTVEITKGQAAASIADTLEKKEVVKSAKAFERVARDDPRSRDIQAATYTLKKHMSAKAAFELMLNTGRVDQGAPVQRPGRQDQGRGDQDPRGPEAEAARGRGGRGDGQAGLAGPAGLREGQPRGLPVPRHVRRAEGRDRDLDDQADDRGVREERGGGRLREGRPARRCRPVPRADRGQHHPG